MKSVREERATQRAVALAGGRLVLERLETMLVDAHPLEDRDIDVQELGRIEGLQLRHDQIQSALALAPARAEASLRRIHHECSKLRTWLEREAAAEREPGMPYEWGFWQADFDLLHIWPEDRVPL
jgi:hypothetical protein